MMHTQLRPDVTDSCHFAPGLSNLLRSVALDVTYHRAAGEWLYHHDADGREVEVLDLVGGYGAVLLGHMHPALVAVAKDQLLSGRPQFAQGSLRHYAPKLARELSSRAGGDYRAVFANSGAEAVEAAMKHAMLETGGRTFIALEGGFHGKTLGAIQLTANPDHREPFTLPGLSVHRVRPNDIEHLEATFERARGVAGFVFEPIQGEGGVRPLDAGFVQRAAELCVARGVPLIADECQTGVGRTGRFFACESLCVRPDYVLLSKALGGGLAKIAAVLIDRSRYVDPFDLKHTSTFAADEFSCAIGLKVLELIDEAALAACREAGNRIVARLRKLQSRFPRVIADVRGQGLMIGVEFARQSEATSYLLRYLTSQEQLVVLLSGYMLRAHRVRVAPTLSDPFALRLAPPLGISERAVDQLIGAMEDVCERIELADVRGLTSHLTHDFRSDGEPVPVLLADWKPCSYRTAPPRIASRRASARVAWLCHLVDADDLVSLDEAFAASAHGQRQMLLDRLAPLANPVLMNEVDVRSSRGQTVRLFPVMLPVTSQWMKGWIDARAHRQLTALVRKGLEMARSLGCSMVSLGQYTSIATLGGTTLVGAGVGLTTGNSYAIALAIDAIGRAQRERGVRPEEATLAIVGAAGNIGRTCAAMLAPQYRRVLLVGAQRPDSIARLRDLAAATANAVATLDVDQVAAAEVVVAAASAVNAPLIPQHFAPGAIVCDLSVPAAVDRRVHSVRPDVLVIKGGIARLPGGEDLGIVGFPLPPGMTYGCMAEGILLGLEGVTDATFTGSLRAEHVARVRAMAQRHGFALADYKSSCVLGSEPREAACA
jgi:acetylornithine/succinyldiaminopimelate/putrescine aminotransferase/predicted amino acid dehydrogenase